MLQEIKIKGGKLYLKYNWFIQMVRLQKIQKAGYNSRPKRKGREEILQVQPRFQIIEFIFSLESLKWALVQSSFWSICWSKSFNLVTLADNCLDASKHSKTVVADSSNSYSI